MGERELMRFRKYLNREREMSRWEREN